MCTQIDRDISVGIDTGAHRDIEGHQCVYRQVHAQIDKDTSVVIDTGAQTDRLGH